MADDDDRTKDAPVYGTDNDRDQDGFDEPEQPLQQDFERPAADPTDAVDPTFPVDHPVTDTGVDPSEEYDAGLKTASGADVQDETPESGEDDEGQAV